MNKHLFNGIADIYYSRVFIEELHQFENLQLDNGLSIFLVRDRDTKLCDVLIDIESDLDSKEPAHFYHIISILSHVLTRDLLI